MTNYPSDTDATLDVVGEFLASTEGRTEEVTLFANQRATQELEELYKRQNKLLKASHDTADERTYGGDEFRSELDEINSQIPALEEKVIASRSVWTMRALRRDELVAIEKEFPLPRMPIPTDNLESKQSQAAWKRRSDEYAAQVQEVNEKRAIAEIAKSCVSVETARGRASGVTHMQLHKMLDAEYGKYRIDLLHGAVKDATDEERKEMPRPKSSSTSGSDQA